MHLMRKEGHMESRQAQILILDFGSQYTQLIARRLREYGIYTEILPYSASLDALRAKNPRGLILSGGPASIYDEDAYKPDSKIFDLGLPILGICYGMQYIADFFGGKVAKASKQEYGQAKLKLILESNPASKSQDLENQAIETYMPLEEEFKLEGKNLYLRRLVIGDLPDLKEMLQDKEVMSAWGRILSEEEALEWLQNQLDSYRDYGFGLWAVIEKSSSRMVGQCGLTWQKIELDSIEAGKTSTDGIYKSLLKNLSPSDYLNRPAKKQIDSLLEKKRGFLPELGYIFKKSQWHKGYATEAAKLCMEYAFEVIGLPLLTSLIRTDGIAPQNVAKRLEMRIVAKTQRSLLKESSPHFVYALKGSEWQSLALGAKQDHSREVALEFTSFRPATKAAKDGDKTGLSPDLMEEILKIWRDCISATHHFLRPEHIAIMEDSVREVLPSLHIIIASDYRANLGFIGLSGNRISMIFVTPSAFKRGIGSALIKRSLELGLGDYDELKLDCFKQNDDALRFYKHLGFEKVGISPKDGVCREFPVAHLEVSTAKLLRFFGVLYNRPLFETQRLIVREMKSEDLGGLNDMLLDYEVMGSWEYNFNDSSVQEWLDTQLERYKKFGFGLWAVVEKDSGEMIGQAGFSLQNFDDKRVLGLTYIIKKSMWHKGYGLEVAQGCKLYAFEVLRAKEIYLLIKDSNEASKSVANKLGASFIGDTVWSYRGREMQRLVYRIKNSARGGFILETGRTVLRPLGEEHYNALKSMLQDSNIMTAWGGVLSDEGVREWIEKEKKNYAKFGVGWWIIEDKQSGEFIGQAGLSYTQRLELSYMIKKDHWHKGYALEVALGCKDYAFKQLRAKELYCLCREDNPASCNVAKRIGMDKTRESYNEQDGQRYYEFRALSRLNPLSYKKHNYGGIENVVPLVSSLNLEKAGLKISRFNLMDSKDALELANKLEVYLKNYDASNPQTKNLLSSYDNCFVLEKENEGKLVGLLANSSYIASDRLALFLDNPHDLMHGAFLLGAFARVYMSENLLISCLQKEGLASSEARLGECEDSMACLGFYENLGFRFYDQEGKARIYSITRSELLRNLEKLAKGEEVINQETKNIDLRIFKGVKQNSTVWMSHADKVESLPKGFVQLASSNQTEFCAIADSKRQIYALQFHPEVAHSECGGEILKNFALEVCKAETSWTMKSFAKEEIDRLRRIALNVDSKKRESKVLCAISGGVDSSVVALLLHKAVGDNLVPILVDNGLLRRGEKDEVIGLFKTLDIPLIVANAGELFLGRLAGVVDPEEKRKIIGRTFIEVFENEASKQGGIAYLAQGTLYPDIIESISLKGPSKTIKSHHNVGGLPEKMNFKLIEPLRELFKDEVRKLGMELGLPESMLIRHPFPGPGLAIRLLGEVTKERLEILRNADSILIEELHKNGLYKKVWQAFCVLIGAKSVGVVGDNRSYSEAICVRVVDAVDGMTASFSHLPHEFLENISSRITSEVAGINRVVYDITSKPPGTIEWE